MEKIYKIRIFPDEKQKEFINKTFVCYRFVYNYFLKRRNENYSNYKRNLNLSDCSTELTLMKQSEPFTILQDVDSIALQRALVELDDDFQAFFEHPIKSLYPQFKNKTQENYYITARKENNIYFDKGYVRLPKMSKIKMEDKIKTPNSFDIETVEVKKSIDKYYIILHLYDDEEDDDE